MRSGEYVALFSTVKKWKKRRSVLCVFERDCTLIENFILLHDISRESVLEGILRLFSSTLENLNTLVVARP